MTNKKRDESTKRYPPIQQDPARRIRRIQRWSDSAIHSGGTTPDLSLLFAERFPDSIAKTDDDFFRQNTAGELFSNELTWLCSYASVCQENSLEAHQAAFRAISTERTILDDVKAWASEEINELRQTIAEQKARIEELERGRVPLHVGYEMTPQG